MNLKKKVLPLAMTLLLGVGSIGVANAAAPIDFQQKMAAWIQNDPNPMPMNMNTNMNTNTNNLSAITPSSTGTGSSAANASTPAVDITKTNNQTPAPAATQQSGTTAPSNNKVSKTVKSNSGATQNNTYNDMVQACLAGNQQMMNNMTPEQMLEMDKAWAEAMSKNQKNASGNKQANANKSWDSKSGGQSWNCGW